MFTSDMTSILVANTSALLQPTIVASVTPPIHGYIRNLGIIKAASPTVYIVLSLLALTGNAIVLRTIMDLKEKKPFHILITSLAMADILVGLILLPGRLCEVLRAPWTMYLSYCRVAISLSLLSLSASIFNLSLIVVDRYISITSPLKYRCNMTLERVIKWSIIVWAGAILVSISPTIGFGTRGDARESKEHLICLFKETLQSSYLIVYVGLSVLLPTVLITVLQFCAVVQARAHFARHKVIIRSQRCSERNILQEKMVLKKEIRLLCMFKIVIALFYFCWLPLIIGIFMSALRPMNMKLDVIFFLSIPVYGNSGLNPLVYLLGNRAMRHQMLSYFEKRRSYFTCCRKNRVANCNDITQQT